MANCVLHAELMEVIQQAAANMDLRALLSVKVVCFQHCSNRCSQFHWITSPPPSSCSHCGQALHWSKPLGRRFELEPFVLPSPFFTDGGLQVPVSGTLLLPLIVTIGSADGSSGVSWVGDRRGVDVFTAATATDSKNTGLSPYHVGIVDERGTFTCTGSLEE